jgi:hypothetical protein
VCVYEGIGLHIYLREGLKYWIIFNMIIFNFIIFKVQSDANILHVDLISSRSSRRDHVEMYSYNTEADKRGRINQF